MRRRSTSAACAAFLIATAVACAAPSVDERSRTAAGIAADAGLRGRHIRTKHFTLLGYWRPAKRPGAGLRVYIEGDGLAWVSRRKVSADPTPVDPVALRLAAADPDPAAILYLARPCQFVGVEDPPCGPSEWTNRRFSQEATDAIAHAIDHTMAEMEEGDAGGSRPTRLEIVGYSGGGVLAANVSAQRSDVALLVSVAAPLDLAGWVTLHAVSPLLGSLDPASQSSALASIPQLHFVGADDANVPIALTRSYLAALGDPPGARVVEVPDFGHHCCWARHWPRLMAEMSTPDGAR